MPSENDSTPIPLQVLASLRNLTGEEFKIIGALCYLTFNKQTPQVTIEQIQALTGISQQQIKPALHRLLRRAWIINHGASYQLAFQNSQSSLSANPPESTVKYDPALGIRPPRPKAHLLYPEGPWLTENGLLNEDFIRDRAQVWRTGNHPQAQAFGTMAIEDVMGAVCKHYAKPEHHASLEIDWQSYCLKNQRYLSNIQQRLHAGTTIDEEEQATVLKKLPAVMQGVLPIYESAELSNLPDSVPAPALPESSVEPHEDKPSNPEGAYHKLLASKTVPTTQLVRDRMTEVEKLKLWLSDNILRSEAEKLARAKGYELEYNESGVPVDIVIDEKVL